MPLPRDLRTLICRALIGVLVFAQLAIAAYACPAAADARVDTAAQLHAMADMDAMPDCDETMPGAVAIDPDAANLCVEHCRFGQQSADTPVVTPVFAAPPTLLYALPLAPDPVPGSDRAFPAIDSVTAAAPTPHAILHCVLRI